MVYQYRLRPCMIVNIVSPPPLFQQHASVYVIIFGQARGRSQVEGIDGPGRLADVKGAEDGSYL